MELQKMKAVIVTPPVAIVDNAAAATTAIDTFGCEEVAIYVVFGAMDIAVTDMKVRESDASNMGSPNDITGLVWGTSTNPDSGATSSVPIGTSDNTIWAAFIKLGNGRKRYIDIEITLGDGSAGTYATAIAILKPKVAPSTAALRGLSQNLIA